MSYNVSPNFGGIKSDKHRLRVEKDDGNYYPNCTSSKIDKLKRNGIFDEITTLMLVDSDKKSVLYNIIPAPKEIGGSVIFNGSFTSDTKWTKGTGWSIANDKATCDGTQSAETSLSQTGTGVSGNKYLLRIVCINKAGGAYKVVYGTGGSDTGWIAEGGVFEEIISWDGSDDTIFITGTSTFIGSIDSVSLIKVDTDYEDFDVSRNGTKTIVNSEGYLEEVGLDVIGLSFEDGCPYV